MNWIRPETIKENTRTYTNDAHALRFLLGGLGTGNVSLDASGRLCDFEFFHHPEKHVVFPYNFFALWTRVAGQAADARVIEAKPTTINDKALGVPSGELPGLPRFERSRFSCQYPFARIAFEQPGLPFEVSLEAYTPFIPLNARDSGFPGFRADYTVRNLSDREAEVAVAGSMYNLCGFRSFNGYDMLLQAGTPKNREFREDGLSGVAMCVSDLPADDIGYGSMCLAVPDGDASVKHRWQSGGWFDGAEDFWRDFRDDGALSENIDSQSVGSQIRASHNDRLIGSVAVKKTLRPGECATFTFYYVWHFPNRYGWWPDSHKDPADSHHRKIWRNYYAGVWRDAPDAVRWLHHSRNQLERHSRNFAAAVYSSTLSADVIESLIAAITVLRSPTCFRIESGEFFGWEGCGDRAGSCAGNCTHVWNYAQAAAYLFPDMERSMRRTEFLTETDERGNMAFRATTLLSGERWDMLPAADGQLGSILRAYREWNLSGDDAFLREIWPGVVRAMDFSLREWDHDGDSVLDGQQHNTYDIEFYGINSLTNSMLYAALTAAVRMASHLGDADHARRWQQALDIGSHRMDELLWNGEYYRQLIDDEALNHYRYQYGNGCLSDQLLGQSLAHQYALGYVLPEEHVRSAIRAVWRYNFLSSLANHHSVQRGYVNQNDAGLILCSWPHGGRPRQPFVYSDEVWTGIEYQVAAHLIYEGMIREALEIVSAIRARHDGIRRSPFNEVECGNHYARSMAAWGVLIALNGFEIDSQARQIRFSPVLNASDFCCFYSTGSSWGVLRQTIRDGNISQALLPLYGEEPYALSGPNCT